MISTIVTLNTGLKVGEKVFKQAVITEATVGDLLAATDAANQVVKTSEGQYVMVADQTKVALYTLARQIRFEGLDVFTPAMISNLTLADLEFLQLSATAMEIACMGEDSASDPDMVDVLSDPAAPNPTQSEALATRGRTAGHEADG